MRSARTSRMRAFVCEVSVTMPACEPVSEIARWPRSLIAIAHSAQEMRSPVDSSMSISRGSGVGETSSAIEISSSVVLPRADSTRDDAVALLAGARRSARAARLMRSASATEVPPNFMTTVPGTERASLGTRRAERSTRRAIEPAVSRSARATCVIDIDNTRGALAAVAAAIS